MKQTEEKQRRAVNLRKTIKELLTETDDAQKQKRRVPRVKPPTPRQFIERRMRELDTEESSEDTE